MKLGGRGHKLRVWAILVSLWPAVTHAQGNASKPPLEERLAALDRQAGNVHDLVASFEESKHTALLKKPLVSTGRVRIVGDKARWDTEKPHRGVMVMDPTTIRIYYPERGALEIYDIDEKMARLAISPLPRLSALRAQFEIEEMSPADVSTELSSPRYLGLRMTPRDTALLEYLDHVDVVLDTETTFVVRARIMDPDGDETELVFRDVRTNTGLGAGDVELVVPEGTTESRPLAGLQPRPQEANRGEKRR